MTDPTESTVCVIIATHRRPQFFPELLDALVAQDHPDVEVIVVDDGSPETDFRQLVNTAEGYDGVRVLGVPNGGPARARNYAAEHSTSEWLLFTDDDCIPQPGWVSEMLAEAARTSASVVQGCTRSDPRPNARDLGWWARGKDVVRWTNRFQMCNLAIRASAFRESGGLDERFPPSGFGEDTDLGLRLVAAGHRTAFAPEAVVWHRMVPMTYVQFLRRRARWAQVIRVAAISPNGRSTFPHRYIAQRTHVAFWAAIPFVVAAAARGWWWVPVAILGFYAIYRARKTRSQPWPLWVRVARSPLEFVGVGVEAVAFVVGSVSFRTILI